MDPRTGGVTKELGSAGDMKPIDVCPGCGERMTETGTATVFCDEKGHPVHLLRVCTGCAELFATGTAEDRIELFDRIGEVELAFSICPCLEKKMAVH